MRISAGTTPGRWLKHVLRWCAKQGVRPLARGQEARLELEVGETRLRSELDAVIDNAIKGSKQHSINLLIYFYSLSKAGRKLDSRILGYLEFARQRFNKDPRRDTAKALGLVAENKGNQGQGRKLSREQDRNAGMRFLDLRKKRMKAQQDYLKEEQRIKKNYGRGVADEKKWEQKRAADKLMQKRSEIRNELDSLLAELGIDKRTLYRAAKKVGGEVQYLEQYLDDITQEAWERDTDPELLKLLKFKLNSDLDDDVERRKKRAALALRRGGSR